MNKDLGPEQFVVAVGPVVGILALDVRVLDSQHEVVQQVISFLTEHILLNHFLQLSMPQLKYTIARLVATSWQVLDN